MKVNGIKKACLATGNLYGIDAGRYGKYISNGRAAWPLPDGIDIEERTLLEMLDYSAEQESKTYIDTMAARDVRPWNCTGPNTGEIALKSVCCIPGVAGDLLLLEQMDTGETYAVQEEDVRPARIKGQIMRYTLRGMPDGRESDVLVACYNGMNIGAIIKPISNLSGVFAYLEELSARRVGYVGDAALVMDRDAPASAEESEAGEQMGMELDEE